MTTFEFGEFKTEFDNTDVNFAEKYEKASETYNDEILKTPKTGRGSEQYKYMCDAVRRFFDSLFGDGTGALMFGERFSVEECAVAFKLLIEKVRDVSFTLEKMRISDAPLNREQRRLAAKKK